MFHPRRLREHAARPPSEREPGTRSGGARSSPEVPGYEPGTSGGFGLVRSRDRLSPRGQGRPERCSEGSASRSTWPPCPQRQ
jgi:hypothetical protein